MKVSSLILLIIVSAGITIPTSIYSQETKTNDQVETPAPTPQDFTLVDEHISKMSVEQKIGQLLMIGILESKITKNLKQRIEAIKPGFLILFRKNIVTPLQTANLIYGIQQESLKSSGLQMIAAVDQEGGDVVRIPTKPSLPTALALGRSFDLESTYSIGKYVGEVLSVLGIHMNLAPVLDLSDPEKMSFIQTRSFGGNPNDVAKISNQFAAGVQSSGVLSTAKHFPGLGNMKDDSHKKMVQNTVSKEDFFAKYLKPYEELIKEKTISAIMMTHLVYPELDPSLKPATFSPSLVNILKNSLNFSGLIITDDIEMAGAKYYKTSEERATQAFLAGNDILMVAWNKKSQQAVYNGLLSAYRSGAISEERLNSSLRKIVSLKLALKLDLPKEKPNSKIILSKLRDNSLKQPVDSIFSKIMSQELKHLENKNLDLNLDQVTVVSSDYGFFKKFKTTYKSKANFIPITKNFSFKDHAASLNNSSLMILNVSGPYSAKVVNSFPTNYKRKSIVLNSRFLGSIHEEESFLDVLQLSMKHADVGSYLGEFLKSSPVEESIERGLSSAAGE